MRLAFGDDNEFEPLYGLIDPQVQIEGSFAEALVEEAEFLQADDAIRLAREFVMAGPAPGQEDSDGWQAHCRFLDLIESSQFATLLTDLTGIDQLERVDCMPRIMRNGDFCREHDDTATGRRLCMLFYVDDAWRPGFGGRFQNVAAGQVVRSVAPLANRVLLHQPRIDQRHQVEAFGSAAADWARWTYSVWFSESA